MKKKQKHEKEPNHERWLLSYADFITLLFVFFVILYSMSSINEQKYRQIQEAFNVAMGGGKSIIPLNETPGSKNDVNLNEQQKDQQNQTDKNTGKTEKDTMTELKKQLDSYLDKNGLKSSVTSVINERGLQVSINDAEFFDSGKALIKPESRNRLIEIGKILNQMPNYFRVEGHTDNVPIYTSEFKNNWQLSVIRATNVTELLINDAKIPPVKISATGYGETRPIADNKTEDGRSKNRRVDIIILDSKFNVIEESK